MSAPLEYFSLGETLNAMQNVEIAVGCVPPTYQDEGRIPRVGSVLRKVGSGRVRADGFIQTNGIRFDKLSRAEYRALLLLMLGGYNVNSREVYVSWIDDVGYYLVAHGWIDRPTKYRDFTPATMTGVVFPLHDLILQSVTQTDDYTVRANDHLVYGDTSAGNIELTLLPASIVYPWVVYSQEKAAAANTLTITADGGDLINGVASVDLTDLYARLDLVSDGVSNWYAVFDETS